MNATNRIGTPINSENNALADRNLSRSSARSEEPVVTQNVDKNKPPAVIHILKGSAEKIFNDLHNLATGKTKHAKADVIFKFYSKTDNMNQIDLIEMHSLVLFARSAWFRRCWRMWKIPEEHQQEPDKSYFNFNHKQPEDYNFFEIQKIEIPDKVGNRFEFKILVNQMEKEFVSSFQQFSTNLILLILLNNFIEISV